MQNFLKALKISELNKGVSTGTTWISASGEKIKSFSPVDGKQMPGGACPLPAKMRIC